MIWAGTTFIGAAAPYTLRVGWEPYAPYTYVDANGVVSGADIELTKAVGEEIHCALGIFSHGTGHIYSNLLLELEALGWPLVLNQEQLSNLNNQFKHIENAGYSTQKH
ncbi:MAG: hypothetical protein V2J55_19980 [Candidatus Competibacteraceae bacterium]|nr:hypothetical protein [Candidatus Competibacteraceae bacterium]